MNGYELSRDWFNFCFENPEKIRPTHTALYFFAVDLCNRLAWKEVFGLTTTIAMEAIGIRSYKTYKQTLTDIVDWGFLRMVEVSKNQHSSNKVALVKNAKASTKALDKAILKQVPKQVQSTVSIDKHINQETIEQTTEESMYQQIQEATSYTQLIPLWQEYLKTKGRYMNLYEIDVLQNSWAKKKLPTLKQEMLKAIENGWKSLVEIKTTETEQSANKSYYKDLT
jgi:hypothetical protein